MVSGRLKLRRLSLYSPCASDFLPSVANKGVTFRKVPHPEATEDIAETTASVGSEQEEITKWGSYVRTAMCMF